MTSVDVVIWGAGIAGSQLARSLSKSGVSIAVIPRGPASYPQLPGFGGQGTSCFSSASLERKFLAEADLYGGLVLNQESVTTFHPLRGPVLNVTTDRPAISTRCVVFADGSDPRIGRARGLLPEWEPWQLVHFAWQQVDAEADHFQVISGLRRECPWRGYLVGVDGQAFVGVGWNLQHEMDTHIHVTELLIDVQAAFSITGNLIGEPAVEVVPYEPRFVAAPFFTDNLLAIGDVTGIVNPLSLRRTELSSKMGERASQLIVEWLKTDTSGLFHSRQVRDVFRPLVNRELQRDFGPPMPPIPRPPGRNLGVGAAIRQMIDRVQR